MTFIQYIYNQLYTLRTLKREAVILLTTLQI